ncbi:MAG: hypothetical protein QOG94_1316 [Solirubrobacteraceae bacterium]|nr:hypothetical protein [Solirubrobacteraceae bacterium]
MLRRPLLIAIVLALSVPPAASAGTASIGPLSSGPVYGMQRALLYAAAPGERNRIALTADAATPQPYDAVLRDSAAVVVAGPGCDALDEHAVRCVVEQPPSQSVTLAVVIDAGDGDDTVSVPATWANPVEVRGGDGRDVLTGSGTLDGGAGDDMLTGGEPGPADAKGAGPVRDFIAGGPGDDVLRGGRGPASFSGGAGDDVIAAGAGGGSVSYAERRVAVRVDLADERGVAGAAGERDRISGVDTVYGGAGDDVLRGDGGANRLDGGPGDDRLVGRGGNDQLLGRAGVDTLDGRAGDDDLDGGPGRDSLRGGPGADELLASSDGDALDGGAGDDRFIPRLARSLSCGSGDDVVARPRGGLLAGCETVLIGAQRFPAHSETLSVAARPKLATGGVLRLPWSCNATAGRCDLRVGVRRLDAAVDRAGAVILERGDVGTIVIRSRRHLRRGQLVTVSISGAVYSSSGRGGRTISFSSFWRVRL